MASNNEIGQADSSCLTKLRDYTYKLIKEFEKAVKKLSNFAFVNSGIFRLVTKKVTVERVGVDLGVKTLAYLSTGIVFSGAKSYKRYEKKLAKLQWRNRNKVIGSANWKKAQIKIARLHRRIANIRKDTLNKLTTYLAKNHSKIVVEDLNVSGMLKNRKLAKAIADMGFYEFRRQLEYKCKLYGSQLIVADRFFPSSKTCSNCGWYNPDLKLSDRWFLCVGCGSFIERDWNASLNLANTASHAEIQACG